MRKAKMSENELMEQNEDMLPEYHLDYSKARPNRFAKGIAEGSLVVVLEPDVAEIFPDSESVNTALRLLVEVADKSTSKASAH
jgi:hypothetical protein